MNCKYRLFLFRATLMNMCRLGKEKREYKLKYFIVLKYFRTSSRTTAIQ